MPVWGILVVEATIGFTYRRAPLTQHTLLVVLLLPVFVALGLGGLERPWAWLIAAVPGPALVVGGPWVLHQVLFWVVVALFHVVDTTDRPLFIARHRIQDGPGRMPSFGVAARRVLVNQLVWAPLMLMLMGALLYARGWAPSAVLPSVTTLALEMVGLAVAAGVIFYTTHRFLHRPWWMRRVHSVHHEFTTSRAIASEYAHPVEFCIGNFGTLAGGIVLLAPSMLAILLFTCASITVILVHHAGYALPWAPWAIHHDWHHYRSREAFGTIGILDRLLGTDPELASLEHGDRR